ncbi:MAG: adenylate/guanylate cyclase domain-containing protein [Magnetococcales bacterium]|nr:adenylate/guanylate cyclase domain-containing protein [Magnetococcales bacterium]
MKVDMAVMFTDLVGSTKLYNDLGDEFAQKIIADYLEVIRNAATPHHGNVIKKMGDGALIVFPTAEAAARAAREMMRHCHSRWGDKRMKLRIGFSFGPVQFIHEDAHGETVNRAARLLELKGIDEILLDESTAALLSIEQFAFEFYKKATLKGFPGQHSIHRLEWRE